MRVTISVGGRFHAFQLAQQIHQRGWLERLLTTYYGKRGRIVPREKVKTFLLPEAVMRLPARIPGVRGVYNGGFHKAELFDWWAARNLPESDIVVAWSGFGLRTLKQAKERGALAFLERGSTHIQEQQRLLSEEYARHGLASTVVDPRSVEKELEEYALADWIVVPTEYCARTFRERGCSNVLVVPYGADIGQFQPIPKEDDCFRVVFAGGVTFRKGVPYLIEALDLLGSAKVEVWFAGGVDPAIIRMRHLGLDRPNIRLLGAVPHAELPRFYSRGSVFVLPSIEEGLPLAMLEAMAMGLPIIASEATGAASVIQDGREGFVVPIRDSSAIAKKLTFLMENPAERQAMATYARERALAQTWDRYGETVAEAYLGAFPHRGGLDRHRNLVEAT
ncbi:MAG: glycosyltransferase family 4 protein [Deltaproteobacteria bacterium]